MDYVYNLEFGAYKISFTDGAKNPFYYIKKKYIVSSSEFKVCGGFGNHKLLVYFGPEVKYEYEQVSEKEFINSDIKYNSYLEDLNLDKIPGSLFYIDSNAHLNPYYDPTVPNISEGIISEGIISKNITSNFTTSKVRNDIRQKISSEIVLTLDP